jgi:hypothetical protein
MTNNTIRFFGVIDGDTGYALDFYPEERDRYARQFRSRIIGEFDNAEDAQAAVMAEMQRRAKARRQRSPLSPGTVTRR